MISACRLSILPFAALLALLATALPAQQPPKVPDGFELVRNVEFGRGGDVKLAMHIVRPKARPAERLPVLVYIAGSAWMFDNKDAAVGKLVGTAQRGYFCAAIQVRSSGQAAFPAQLADAKCAIRFLRAKAAEFHLDPDRIGVWGDSSGGHLAALVGLTADHSEFEGTGGWPEFSSRVQAVAPMCPAVDFLVSDWPARHNDPGGPVFNLLQGDPRKDLAKAELARRASPLTYITKGSQNTLPFYIIHGGADTIVPTSQGRLLQAALEHAGLETTLEIIPGGDHASVHHYDMTGLMTFFDKHLTNNNSSR